MVVEIFSLIYQTSAFGLILINVPVNNFLIMLGWSHHFLGIYQYFGEIKD